MGEDTLTGAALSSDKSAGLSAQMPFNQKKVQISIREVNNGFIINVTKTLYGPTEEHIAFNKVGVVEIIERSL